MHGYDIWRDAATARYLKGQQLADALGPGVDGDLSAGASSAGDDFDDDLSSTMPAEEFYGLYGRFKPSNASF